jgi:EAL domain-containing protein (putative c-di-GMP-specific phosphodiesterase class I)
VLAARKVMLDLQHPFVADFRPLLVSASIGIAGVPWHGATCDEVMRKADAAMYLAKKDKTGYVVYDRTRDQRAGSRTSLATAMRQAIDGREFIVDYQPIVHLPTNRVQAVESLVRWNHPKLGRLMPDDFIRIAEHTGLVNPLTSFVLDRALSEWPGLAQSGACGVAVNISPRSLHHTAFPERVRNLLELHGVPASSLTLEVTESFVVTDPDGSIRCLNELHEMGVRLVIDDFGKGYSSLSHLRRIRADEIKIDRSFIIALDDGDETLVKCMINLAHDLGMSATAEGVESEAVLDLLVGLGCDAAQGYFLVKPGPAAEITKWLDAREVSAD